MLRPRRVLTTPHAAPGMLVKARRTLLVAAVVLSAVLAVGCSREPGSDAGSPSAPGRTSTTSTTQPLTDAERIRRETGTIVFEAGAGQGERLVAVDVGTWEERPLTSTPGFTPRLSPDGTLLAYAAKQPDDPEGLHDVVHVLSMVDGSDRLLGPGACPGWTRDGTALVVSREDHLVRLSLEGEATPVPGGDADGCAAEVGHSRYVAWAQGPELTLIDHGRRSRLLRRPGCGIGPVAPDASGERLAMTITCDDTDGLYVMDLPSGEVTQLVDGPSYGAAWSPAGTMLATASEHDGDAYQLWWACPCDPPDPLLIRKGGTVNNPTWGPTVSGRRAR